MSYNSIFYAGKTLANRVWNAVKDDKQLTAIIRDPEQIRIVSPKEAAQKPPQISIFLYNVTEMASMRNQPTPNQSKPPLYLTLRYLITPLTEKADDDQLLLGKILQCFNETPVLRGSNLSGPLSETGQDLKVALDPLGVEDLSRIWGLLDAPFRIGVGYSVYPVKIEDSLSSEKNVVLKRPAVTVDRKTVTA